MTTICGSAGLLPVAWAQAVPTASKTYQISAFGAGTGTYTGLAGGKNAGITAGVDLGIRSYFNLYPSIEIRGTYPFFKGNIGSVKNLLGGIQVAKHYGNLHPYLDIMIGRGEINYANGGYPNPEGTFQYLQSASTVISPGIGVDYTITRSFAVKADLQLQHYSTPVTTSGSFYAKPITIGVVYRLHFDRFGSR
ncbi:hypothetical protein [Granulicella tundricola]|nr:hypothetical protein [Granulicella tundricola]